MEIRATRPFTGNSARALELARTILASNGFKVRLEGAGSLTATGPGMTSTRRNPLCGISSLRLSVFGGEARAEAELGGVRWMKRFLYGFPPLLGLLLIAVFFLAGLPPFTVLVVAGALAPWVVLSPLLVKVLERNTRKALDALLSNLSG